MTTPEERLRSILYARAFLQMLITPKWTPRVPKEIRREAAWRLKHFPTSTDLYWASKDFKKIFGEVDDGILNIQDTDWPRLGFFKE